MNALQKHTAFFVFIVALTGCGSYIPQTVRTENEYAFYTKLLSAADTVADSAKPIFFYNNLCNHIKGKKAKLETASVLNSLSITKNFNDSLKNFTVATCDSGFFIRTFDMDMSEMFYRFEKPNDQGLGKMYLSDRYYKGFFDEQSAKNKYFIRDYNYTFPRIYYIRENEIHILSGDLNLTDRKVFKRLPVESDTILLKIATYRKDNNDKIYDFNYHLKYVLYNDVKTRWEKVGDSKEDSTLVTKDWINYIEYANLKNIIAQKNISASSLNINLNDTLYEDHWFYAGTLNPFGEWINNNTSIESEKDVTDFISDNTKHFGVSASLYVRTAPPGDYAQNKSNQTFKGNITGSINKEDKIFIKDQKRLRDIKGNTSLWLKIRKVDKGVNKK